MGGVSAERTQASSGETTTMNKTARITDQLKDLSTDSLVLPKRRDQWISLSSRVRTTLSQSLMRYALLVLLIACTLFALFTTSLRPTHVAIRGQGNRTQSITLPSEEHSKRPDQTYVLTGSFSYGLFSQHIVHIVPDNCIASFQINGTSVNLHAIIRGDLCDFTNGFDLDLKSYLQDGTNHFQIRLTDHGKSSWFGLSITHSAYDRQYLVLLQMLLLEVGTLLYFFLKNQLQLPRGCVIVILLGLLLHLLYLSYTPYNVRMHDVMDYGGHLDYVKYVATNWRLPVPNRGWEYFQPPLYYISAAIVYKIANNLAINQFFALQVLSFVYFTVFLIFGVLILRMLCQKKWMLLICTALLAFWPAGVIHAVRIGNDVPYYTLSVIGIYFLLRWLVDKKGKYFYLAALFVALTITTKLNGLILVSLFVCVCLLQLFRKVRTAVSNGKLKNFSAKPFTITHVLQFIGLYLKTPEYVRKALFFIIIIALALYISLFRSISIALHDHHYSILDPNASSDSIDLKVNNSLCNLFCFDLNTYVNRPFTDPWSDEGGRQYLWNYFLKSMLFGEFSFPSMAGQFLARLLSLLLLLIIASSFIGIVSSIRKLTVPNLIMLLWLFFLLLSFLYFRYTNPFAPNQDLRYIFPIIIPLIYFFLTGIEFFIKRKLIALGSLACTLAFLFVLASCCFFIIPLGS